jgi:argininosuccinate lyase
MSARAAERDELIRQHSYAMDAYRARLTADGELSAEDWKGYRSHALALQRLVVDYLAEKTADEAEEFLASLTDR